MSPTYENLAEGQDQPEIHEHEHEELIYPQDELHDQLITLMGEYGQLLSEKGAPAGRISAIVAEHTIAFIENMKDLASLSYRQGQEDLSKFYQAQMQQMQQRFAQQMAQAQAQGQEESQPRQDEDSSGLYL